MATIKIDHVTRIEGHATITIKLDDAGKVADTQFHVTQVRGFEKFTEGRPYYEMPAITARICGICPVSHLLASSKACDAIMAVRIPATAAKLRELLHCAQIVQSHALSFFHLSAPDLLLGMDHDPATRNVAGPARGAPGGPQGRHRPAQVRPDGHRATGPRARASLVDGAGRRQRTAGPAGPRADAGRGARGHGHPEAHAGALEGHRRALPRRDRLVLQLPDHVLRHGRAGRLAAALRRGPALHRG